MSSPLFYRLVGPVLAGGYRAGWAVLRRLPSSRRMGQPRRVLLYPYNKLSAEYLRRTADLIRGDDRIALHATSPAYNEHGRLSAAALAKIVGARHVPLLAARGRWWDLILFASHGFSEAFHPGIQRILINHSLTGGKVVDGENTRYGAKTALRNGQPIFTRMFEASESVRRRAIAQNPVFEPVIALVGDLRVDELLENVRQRDAIRREMGFGPTDRVVLIQSTFGESSLMEAHGEALLAAAKRMAAEGLCKVMVSLHPNHWGESAYALRHPWGKRAIAHEGEGLIVLRPEQKWERFMAAADAAITDHTANAAVFALLGKPMAFVPLPAGVVLSDSIEWRLYEVCPHLERMEELPAMVERLLAEGAPVGAASAADLEDAETDADEESRRLKPPLHSIRGSGESLERVRADILSCPGEAKERMMGELYRALDLTPPPRLRGDHP